ncbi:uncharacterized protein LOC130072421 isoform X2 [Rhinichthys klamathensis goyatoka]|uniref:uncharacterized protein LOC130072421 isoform X2 n=1 Tax=Rhinichthys klamathensis goyatoka TaxID=3034132 RepID=UPI0024B5C8F0|nr:uncharacterized protein LOC130072421 isoform X2 [Rhinichthys klamathensis goyatoka]
MLWSSHLGCQSIGCCVEIAQSLCPGTWTEFYSEDLGDIPRQEMSCSCGVFILMYALNVILGGTFDFSESDIPSIRRWWSVLLLEKFPPRSVMEIQQRKRRRTDKPHKTVATVDQPLNIQELPPLVLREILLEVVLQDGDVAIGSLALTCRCFNSIVSMESFRREAHFRWLDSVVNWKAFSENVRNLYRVPYSLSRCLHCDTTYKDCGEGYRGRGQRGVLQGFYGSDDSPGYCGDCFYVAGGSI